MNTPRYFTDRSRHQAHQFGVSLIELMVALVIGLFLIFGATQIYVKSRGSYEVNDAVARLQESARYAMSNLEQDIRMAGYYGLYPSQHQGSFGVGGAANQTTDAVSPITTGTSGICGTNFDTDLATYIQGDNNGLLPASQGGGAGFLSGTRNAASCAPYNNRASAAADTLTVRRADSDINLSKVLRVCSNTAGARLVNNSAGCPVGVGLQISDLLVHAYYVSQDSTQQVGLPSLRRLELNATPTFADVEIMPGVEDMQVQFGIQSNFTNGTVINGVADQYVNPNSVVLNSPNIQIVSVKVWLLVRGENTEAGFTDTATYQYADRAAYTPNDNYRRLLVSRTFQIRNTKVN